MYRPRLRRAGLALAALAFSALQSTLAFAQADWPQRPVRLLVTVGPGGVADTLSRNLAAGFQALANGQPLVVENRAGAGGTIAATAVTREPPDGYTLFLGEIGPNAVAHVLTKVPYDPATAFTPIIHVANLPAVILVRQELPYKTLAEFITAAKAQPRKFNYASAGVGNWTQIFMAYFNVQAGIEQVNVVFRSGPEMALAVLRGDADTAIISVSTALGQIKEGKLRPLAGISARPIAQLPGTPTVADTLPGFDVNTWHGILGPAGMAPALVDRINGIFNDILKTPEAKKAIGENQAAEIVGGTPQQFDTYIKSELKRWPEVVKALGITAN